MENQEHQSYVGAGFLVIHMAALEQGRVLYGMQIPKHKGTGGNSFFGWCLMHMLQVFVATQAANTQIHKKRF